MPSEPAREEPVYRPSRGGIDPATKRLSIVAGGIAVVLLALVGGWSLSGHRTGTIPVFEPPAGPERVKPANPGGMQLMGADPPPSTADAGTTALAPAPEKPDPQALQAELDRATKDAAATDIPSSAHPAPAPLAAPRDTATAPVAKLPDPTASTAIAPAVPVPAVSPPAATPRAAQTGIGHVEVQLAALDSEAAAQAEWTRLTRKDPTLFAGRKPVILAASRDGKTFYRLRTGGFENVASATGFCERSRAAGAACTIAAF